MTRRLSRILATVPALELAEDVAGVVMLGLWVWWLPDLLAVLIVVTQP